jgi:hypothetical protein
MARQITNFTAAVKLFGHEFKFNLAHRELELGDAGKADYYWMGVKDLRGGNGAESPNITACLEHSAAIIRATERNYDLNEAVHFVAASCYPLIVGDKSLQDVYRDAFPRPKYVKMVAMLPEATLSHIDDIVRSGDRMRVQIELDGLHERFTADANLLPRFQEAFRRWIGNGVIRLKSEGRPGLAKFHEELHQKLRQYRKRSTVAVRQFINMFAYECKASFYRCVANAWISLIPWLREHQRLDQLSERFLRFVHNQNQPIEIPHGRTPAGLYYATHRNIVLMETNASGQLTPRAEWVELPHIGPTHFDTLAGQILSLHPLFSFFIEDADALAKAGRFFTCDGYDHAMIRGRAENCREYWELVGAIMAAAHRYRSALDRQQEDRRVRVLDDKEAENLEAPPPDSGTLNLDALADVLNVMCPDCSCVGQYVSRDLIEESGQRQAVMKFTCPECQRNLQPVPMTEAELREFLSDRD